MTLDGRTDVPTSTGFEANESSGKLAPALRAWPGVPRREKLGTWPRGLQSPQAGLSGWSGVGISIGSDTRAYFPVGPPKILPVLSV